MQMFAVAPSSGRVTQKSQPWKFGIGLTWVISFFITLMHRKADLLEGSRRTFANNKRALEDLFLRKDKAEMSVKVGVIEKRGH